jgi:hypothetical protein
MFRVKILFALILVSALACYADSTAPAVTFNPVKLDIPGVPVGSVSAGQFVTLSNSGNADLNITGITITGEFTETDNCPATLHPNASCSFSISFAPSKSGNVTSTLTITDNASGSPHKFPITGETITGMQLTVATNGALSATVSAGATAVYHLHLASVGGFAGDAKLDCLVPPALTTCTSNPSPVNLTAGGATDFELDMKTTGTATRNRPFDPFHKFEVVFAVCGAFCLGGVFTGIGSRRARLALLLVALSAFGLLGMAACGGGSGTPVTATPPGTYTVQVSATSGSTTQSIALTLIVQ